MVNEPTKDFQNHRPITEIGRSLFVFNGNFNGEMAIILKIVLWAHFTITHAVLRGSTDFLKTTYSGTP